MMMMMTMMCRFRFWYFYGKSGHVFTNQTRIDFNFSRCCVISNRLTGNKKARDQMAAASSIHPGHVQIMYSRNSTYHSGHLAITSTCLISRVVFAVCFRMLCWPISEARSRYFVQDEVPGFLRVVILFIAKWTSLLSGSDLMCRLL